MVQQITVNELIRTIGSHWYKIVTENRKTYGVKGDNRHIGNSTVWFADENIQGRYFRLNSLYKLLQRVQNAYVIISQDMGVWVTTSENECIQILHKLEQLYSIEKLNLPNDLNALIKIVGSKYFGIYILK